MRTGFRVSYVFTLRDSTPSSRCMPQYEQQDVTSSPAKLRNRILVIDDGDWVRNIIGIFLEHAGFAVCGEAADGVEAASVLRTTMPDVPVVLLTLYQNMVGPSLAEAIGVKAVLDKTEGLDK